MHDFNEIVDRKRTYSLKWDGIEERFGINQEDLLPMWVADMDFKTAPPIIEAISDRASHGVFGYVAGYHEEYYKIVLDWFKRRHKTNLEKEWIVRGDTVVATLSRIVRTFTKPNDKIIIQPPVYPPFYNVVKNNGRKVIYNSLKFNGKKYVMDYEDLESKIDFDTKLMILCSPHNPVGRVWTKEELQKLSDICIKHNIILVSDEAHSDIVYKNSKHTMIHKVSDEIKERVIICTSPHKSFNIAGLQISNTIIFNDNIRNKYKTVLENEGITKPNVFALTAIMAAYKNGEEWLDDLIIYLEENLNFVEKFIPHNIPQISFIKPEGTFLAWLNFNKLGLTDKELDELVFDKAKLVLNPGYSYGDEGKGFARLNFACPRLILEEGLNRLKEIINNK